MGVLRGTQAVNLIAISPSPALPKRHRVVPSLNALDPAAEDRRR